jgi:hypothetical protein
MYAALFRKTATGNPLAVSGASTFPCGFDMAEAALRKAGETKARVQEALADLAMRKEEKGDGTATVHIWLREAKPIPGSLAWETELKTCLESLMSSLEYCAVEVFESCCCTDARPRREHRHKEVRFPIPAQDCAESVYIARVRNDIPGLERMRPDVFATLLGFRRFAQGEEVWLTTIDDNWRIAKHQRLPIAEHKPMETFFGGSDRLVAGPTIDVHYFSLKPPRPIIPNLHAALNGIAQIISALRDAVNGSSAAPTV